MGRRYRKEHGDSDHGVQAEVFREPLESGSHSPRQAPEVAVSALGGMGFSLCVALILNTTLGRPTCPQRSWIVSCGLPSRCCGRPARHTTSRSGDAFLVHPVVSYS